ncbi:MAG: hypothetical protein KatS3mg008_1244 [Acidimicrobiales bacterium]|nr:MAG: hypothetical protein KatS3mg008_1244 [Acidimicrobiales bacterium]
MTLLRELERSLSRRFSAGAPTMTEARAFLELLAVSNLAVALPLLTDFAGDPQTFVTLEVTRTQLLALAILLVLGPPASAYLLTRLAGLFSSVFRWSLHCLWVVIFSGLFLQQLLKSLLKIGGPSLVVATVCLSLVVGLSYLRARALGSTLRNLAVLPPLLVAWFLFLSPLSGIFFGREPEVARADKVEGQSGPGTTTTTNPALALHIKPDTAEGTVDTNVRIARPRDVVVVVFDALPTALLLDGSGKVDADLYPNFAALGKQSTFFRNHTTVSTATQGAVPAILTGRMPREGATLASVKGHPRNLFTLLGSRYEMTALEPATSLCPRGACEDIRQTTESNIGVLLSEAVELFGRRVSTDPQDLEPQYEATGVGDRPEVLRTAIDSIRPERDPNLWFIHSVLPHNPWEFTPSGKRYEVPERRWEELAGWRDEATAGFARQRHIAQIRLADRLIGRMISRLRDSGLWDETLLIVTADHGAGFTPRNPHRTVGKDQANVHEIVWVPLFVKFPNQREGRLVEHVTSSIDIVPTIVEELGIKSDWSFDGGLLTRRQPGRERLRVKNPDDFITVDAAAGYRRLLQSRATEAGGDPKWDIYGIGPHQSLVGRAVTGTQNIAGGNAGSGALRADVTGSDAWDDVDTSADVVPVVVEGELSSNRPVDLRSASLAVAVNGRIAATTIFSSKGVRATFATLIPEDALRDGRNDLQIYLVTGSAASPTLSRISID